MNAGDSRLRWRCRRGMRELDQLLGWYLDARYAASGAAQKDAFSALLEEPDPLLWSWLLGQAHAPNPEWQAIVDEIRTRDRV